MKSIDQIKAKLSDVAQYIIETSNCASDYAHEQADQDECVIYYYKAQQTVQNATAEEVEEAEEELKAYGTEFDGLQNLYVSLAFHIVRDRLDNDYSIELASDIDELAEYIEEAEEAGEVVLAEEIYEIKQTLEAA